MRYLGLALLRQMKNVDRSCEVEFQYPRTYGLNSATRNTQGPDGIRPYARHS